MKNKSAYSKVKVVKSTLLRMSPESCTKLLTHCIADSPDTNTAPYVNYSGTTKGLPVLRTTKCKEIKVKQVDWSVGMHTPNSLLMMKCQLTSIENEDRKTDEGCQIKSTI